MIKGHSNTSPFYWGTIFDFPMNFLFRACPVDFPYFIHLTNLNCPTVYNFPTQVFLYDRHIRGSEFRISFYCTILFFVKNNKAVRKLALNNIT